MANTAPLKIADDQLPIGRQVWDVFKASREAEDGAWHDLEKSLLEEPPDKSASVRRVDAYIALIAEHEKRTAQLKEYLRAEAVAACALSQRARAALGEEAE